MCEVTRELITLQVGHYANFVGTHWLNLQEASFVYDSSSPTDINHDFLFREGLTAQRQETYTPRVLCIDVKGSLHSLSERGHLYDPLRPQPSINEAAWEGPVSLIHQLPQEKNQYLRDLELEDARYSAPADEDKDICIDDLNSLTNKDNSIPTSQKIYDLSNSVKVWSDYLRPHYHPDAIYLLDRLLVQGGRGTSDEGEADVWGFPSGASIFQREEVEEEITNRIRRLAESCNSLQGFQLLSDVHNGMGGVSYGILQHLGDDYGSKDTITFGTSPPHLSPSTPQARLLTQAAIIQTYTELSQLSSVVVPLCLRQSVINFSAPCVTFPSLSFKEDNAYESSSILGAFLETCSTAYRTRTSPLPLSALTHILTPAGRKIAGASLSLPHDGVSDGSNISDRRWMKGLVPLSAGAVIGASPISQLPTFRGVAVPKNSRESNEASALLCVTRARDPLKTTSPFPRIFILPSQPGTVKRAVDGSKSAENTPAPHLESLSSVSSLGVLHQGPSVCEMLRPLLHTAKGLDVTKVPAMLEEGIDKDSWLAVVESLHGLVLDYDLDNEEMEISDD